jgi:hypothetical protein
MTTTVRFSEAKRNFARVGARAKRGDVVGHVSSDRRQQIARRLREVFRLG